MGVGGGVPDQGMSQGMYQGMPPHVGKPMLRPMASCNIAAVEPYHHVPNYPTTNVEHEYHKRQDVSCSVLISMSVSREKIIVYSIFSLLR